MVEIGKSFMEEDLSPDIFQRVEQILMFELDALPLGLSERVETRHNNSSLQLSDT